MYRLGEVCGRPLDTTVTLARFILTGVGERHPWVRLLCAHAGGAICTIADRLDFGHELRDYAPLGPWGEVELPEPPSAHVARLYLDTVTYGTAALRPALERVGAGQRRLRLRSAARAVRRSSARSATCTRSACRRGRGDAVLGGNARALFALAMSRWLGPDDPLEVDAHAERRAGDAGDDAACDARRRACARTASRARTSAASTASAARARVLLDGEPVRALPRARGAGRRAGASTPSRASARRDALHAGAAGVPRRARAAVRLLHAGLRRARRPGSASASPRRTRRGSARCSRRTSAAAPATRRSSPPSSRGA